MENNELYAAGLGLLVSSRSTLAAFVAGENYLQGKEPLFHELRENQRVALIQVGSPQIDYRIAAAPPGPTSAYVSYVEFGLIVDDETIVFRDGYDLYEWDPSSEEVFVPSPRGYCRVGIGWSRGRSHSSMDLHVSSVRSNAIIPASSVELLFKP